jgi:hypothetical protein
MISSGIGEPVSSGECQLQVIEKLCQLTLESSETAARLCPGIPGTGWSR